MNLVISLKSLKRGPIPLTGLMGTVLAPFASGTYKDSASLKSDKPTTFEVQVEESDDPLASFATKGKTKLVFQLPDHTPENLQATMGGTIVSNVWNQPGSVPIIEECYQAISMSDVLYEIPRISIVGNLNDEFGKGKAGLIEVEGTILKPNAAIAPLMISKYQPPVITITGSAAPVAAANTLTATAVPYRGVISLMAWTVDSKPLGAPDPTIAAPTTLVGAFSGLVNGTYKVSFTAEDENGYRNTKQFTFVVAIA